MTFAIVSILLALGLFVGMLAFLELGWRMGVKRANARGADASQAGVGVVDGAVYGLLALLVGFMFSGAAQRFDKRRELIAQQENAASTAWQRVSLLPADQQTSVRAAFRRYMDELIAYYDNRSKVQVLLELTPGLTHAERELWEAAVAACTTPTGERARMLLLPSLNELFDGVNAERLARRIHPPMIIYFMLAVAALATALFAGYGMASGRTRNWIYTIGIAATISVATWVIIELEFPRVGLFRVDPMDQVLVALRASMD